MTGIAADSGEGGEEGETQAALKKSEELNNKKLDRRIKKPNSAIIVGK